VTNGGNTENAIRRGRRSVPPLWYVKCRTLGSRLAVLVVTLLAAGIAVFASAARPACLSNGAYQRSPLAQCLADFRHWWR
jgi:hypothetical protein